MNASEYLLIFAATFLAALCVIPIVCRICYKTQTRDIPTRRKALATAVPHMGGIVFLPCMMLGVTIGFRFIYGFDSDGLRLQTSTICMILGAVCIYTIGILDDIYGLDRKVRFVIQTMAALIMPLCNLYISNLHGLFGVYEIPMWLGYIITILAILGIVNATKALDRIDGLAGSLSLLILLAFGILYHQLEASIFTVTCVSLAGGVLAFLLFNLFGRAGRNKIFMGDTGSQLLGYVIAYLAIKYQMTNGGFEYREDSLLISISLIFLPVIDVVRVAILRSAKGRPLFCADETHLHHVLMQTGLSAHATLCSVLLLFVALLGVNALLLHLGVWHEFILLGDICLYALVIYVASRHKTACASCADITALQDIEDLPDTSNHVELYRSLTYSRPDFNHGKIKISIIVATYNSAATIADTLESILAQTYQDYEVVLCDGLSTDGTMDIVNSYQERFGDRLKAVSEADSGIYDAMNKGIDRATGDIIGILNSDDFYTSDDILATIVKTFTTTPLLEAVYGDVHYVKPSNIHRPVRYYRSKHFRPILMRLGFMPAHPSFYCLKELYSTYGKYRLEYKVAADFDQLFRLIFVCRVRTLYIEKDFVTMRTGGASNAGLKSHLQIIRDHTKSMQSYGLSTYVGLYAIRYAYKVISIAITRISGRFL